MKSAIVFFPAVFLDAPAPGEYVRHDGRVSIACIGCGVVQPVERLELRWCCVSPSCAASGWVELATAATS